MSQENLQTMIMQNFLGGKRGVLWDCASSEYYNRQITLVCMRINLSVIATQRLFRNDRTDKEIQARRQKVEIVDKREKSCQITDVAIPEDCGVRAK